MNELKTVDEAIMYLINVSDVLESVRRKTQSQSLRTTQEFLVNAINQLKITKKEIEKKRHEKNRLGGN